MLHPCTAPPPLSHSTCLAGTLFASFNVTFTPTTCFTPSVKPCKLLKRSYTVLPDKQAGVFPPPELGPGEYSTTVHGVLSKGGAALLLVTRMLSVGTK